MAQVRAGTTGRAGYGRRPLGLLLLAPLALAGCGEEPAPQPQPMTHPGPGWVYQGPLVPPPQGYRPQAQTAQPYQPQVQTAQPYAQQVQPYAPPAPATPPGQARTPWQGPPQGFGRPRQQAPMVWPQPQASAPLPEFRPWEEEHQAREKQYPRQPYVAPYDRPMGSSRKGGAQPMWPGYYQAYPGYPGTGTWGVPPVTPWPGAVGVW